MDMAQQENKKGVIMYKIFRFFCMKEGILNEFIRHELRHTVCVASWDKAENKFKLSARKYVDKLKGSEYVNFNTLSTFFYGTKFMRDLSSSLGTIDYANKLMDNWYRFISNNVKSSCCDTIKPGDTIVIGNDGTCPYVVRAIDKKCNLITDIHGRTFDARDVTSTNGVENNLYIKYKGKVYLKDIH